MGDELISLIEHFKRSRDILTYNEAAIKNAVVLRILKALGWDPFNPEEVYPEYSVGDNRVDYALRHNGKNLVFVEVKKANEDLGKHQEQLLRYSFKEGVKLAVLTNGIIWWFYLPLKEINWERRKFYTIGIYDQESKAIAKNFVDFLSKDNVISGKAIENAENIYRNKEKESLIKETLPKAWRKIITEPDELLVELLAETTESMCGHKPENETVVKFLKTIARQNLTRFIERSKSLVEKPSVKKSPLIYKDYTGKSIRAFVFKGRRYPVRTWKEMLVKLAEEIFYENRENFSEALSLSGRKRRYFSTDPKTLKSPHKINGSHFYVETNLNANSIVKIAADMLNLFGYDPNDLTLEYD